VPLKRYNGPFRDYNGDGPWAHDQILRRYADYARQLRIQPRDISPHEHEEHGTRWIYPVMERVIEGIEANDPACILLGIELIEEDAGMPFGKILKSNAARALRRAPLTDEHKHRIRRRVLGMLRAANVPHEYQEYAKLLARIGFDPADLGALQPHLDLANPRVARFNTYLQRAAHPAPNLAR
jgi:hypothetical protein